jgi:heme-degrading monooxygenase HmoA
MRKKDLKQVNNNNMIRIIYSWKVAPENLSLFIETWKKTTNKIHQEVKGARGSFMLQNDKDASEIKTIARWDTLDDWKQFWQKSNPSQMRSMHDLGERVGVEVFKEIDDFTK